MKWLARPLECDRKVVAEALVPANLTDADLRSICLRMQVIFHTVEMLRAEERWMPVELFDAIDTLESMVLHGSPTPPRLAEWSETICKFGTHYQLAGCGPIAINPSIYREVAERYGEAELGE